MSPGEKKGLHKTQKPLGQHQVQPGVVGALHRRVQQQRHHVLRTLGLKKYTKKGDDCWFGNTTSFLILCTNEVVAHRL